jgi:phage-related baseplate assembly protein
MLNLARPNYINRNIAAITNELVAEYESLSNKRLYPGQPERLMIDVIVYALYLLRQQTQEIAEQNLVQYASGVVLEHIAQFYGIARLGALKAKTVLRFTAQEPAPAGSRPTPIFIPAGTVVRSSDGKASFATLSSVEIGMDALTADVNAESLTAGKSANDYAPGSISELLTTIAWLDSVENTVLSHSGADAETDDQLRERIVQAPESFSVAGPVGAYRYHALSAHPAIIDVAVESDMPGRVNVYPLSNAGAPSQEILDAVALAVSDEKRRPLTDTVRVLPPAAKTFSINATVTLYATAPALETKTIIESRLADYATEKRKKLGRDVVPNHIVALIQSVTGVYNVTLAEPTLISVAASEFADCAAITVTLTPAVNEEPVAYKYS